MLLINASKLIFNTRVPVKVPIYIIVKSFFLISSIAFLKVLEFVPGPVNGLMLRSKVSPVDAGVQTEVTKNARRRKAR